MNLLSVFKRKTPVAAEPEAADAVQSARTRARQRLIGAAVLVLAGIIGFPLLFETQPRPLPVDLPIEIPRKDNVPSLAMPTLPSEAQVQPPPEPARPAPPIERVITETPADAGREVVSAASAPASVASVEPPLKPKPVPVPAPRASAPLAAAERAVDGARAQALLEGRPSAAHEATAPAASAARFVVQVGAFAEPAALREARAKVEKLGLKTYTQVAETPAGTRTRVRVGPFATREEADRAAAKVKASALPAVVLTL